MTLRLVGLLLFTLFLLTLSLIVGGSALSPLDLLKIENHFIFYDIRIPRTLAAFFVGGLLGVTGVLLQNLLKNPLAEPYTLGLSGSASFGSILMVFLGVMPFELTMPMASFVLCFLTTAVLILIPNSKQAPKSLILVGTMLSLFFASLAVLVNSLLPMDRLYIAQSFFVGSVGTERDLWWPALFALSILFFVWIQIRQTHVDRLQLGEDIATTLGVPVEKLKKEIIFISCVLVSFCVSVSGLIAFVGLMAPHMAHGLIPTHKSKMQIPSSFLAGSALLLFADTLSRLISQEKEIPSGAFTAFLGAPLLIYLIVRRSRESLA